VTIAGTAFTFVASGATGTQVNIGATLSATVANLVAAVATNVTAVTVSSTGNVVYLVAASSGTSGNAITLAKSSSAVTLSGATLSGGSGTDISGLFAATATSSGVLASQGVAPESAVSAVALFDNIIGQSFYGLVIPQAADTDHIAVATLVESLTNAHMYGVTTQEAGVLSSASTTDIASLLAAGGYTRTVTQYSSNSAYAVCSLMGRILTTNYNGNSTVITLMYKQEPGVSPETLNQTQLTALLAKNCNVFLTYSNATSIIQPGVMASGLKTDVRAGVDWLATTMQTALYNVNYTSTTKIPQTDAGMQVYLNIIDAVCAQGVANGLIAPGIWTNAGFGALSTGQLLERGYYSYAPPMSSQLAADRAARKSTSISVAVKLAGAIEIVVTGISVAQ
jgi:hypothetical protein